MDNKIKCYGIVGGVVLVVLVVLMIWSIDTVEPIEYGVKYNNLSRNIDEG